MIIGWKRLELNPSTQTNDLDHPKVATIMIENCAVLSLLFLFLWNSIIYIMERKLGRALHTSDVHGAKLLRDYAISMIILSEQLPLAPIYHFFVFFSFNMSKTCICSLH